MSAIVPTPVFVYCRRCSRMIHDEARHGCDMSEREQEARTWERFNKQVEIGGVSPHRLDEQVLTELLRISSRRRQRARYHAA